jgi:hypothetical protein
MIIYEVSSLTELCLPVVVVHPNPRCVHLHIERSRLGKTFSFPRLGKTFSLRLFDVLFDGVFLSAPGAAMCYWKAPTTAANGSL